MPMVIGRVRFNHLHSPMTLLTLPHHSGQNRQGIRPNISLPFWMIRPSAPEHEPFGDLA